MVHPRSCQRRLGLWLLAVTGALFLARAEPSGWLLVQSENFEALTNGSEKQARQRIERLESVRAALGELFAMPVSNHGVIRVLLIARHAEFARLRPTNMSETARIDGLAQQTPYEGQLAVLLDEDKRVNGHLTQHELLHLLARDAFRPVPAWYAEGLACYYQTLRVDGARVWVGEPPLLFVNTLQKAGGVFLEDLLELDRARFNRLNSHALHRAYAESWLLMHYLQSGLKPADRAKLPTLWRQVRASTNSAAAFASVMGWSVAELEGRMKEYWSQKRIRGEARQLSRPPRPRLRVTPAGAADSAAWFALWLGAADRVAEAVEIADAAGLSSAAGYYPQLATGFLAFESSRKSAAVAAFRAALQERPDSAIAMAYLGRSLVDEALSQHDSLPSATEVDARRILNEAIRRQPGLQPALAALAAVGFYGTGEPAEARGWLTRALELDPGDARSEFLAGLLSVRERRWEDARKHFEVVAAQTRVPGLSEQAAERLAQLPGVLPPEPPRGAGPD